MISKHLFAAAAATLLVVGAPADAAEKPAQVAPDGVTLRAPAPTPVITKQQPLRLPSGLVLSDVRSIDGTNNNLTHTTWGAAHTPFLRNTTVDYADGTGSPAGQHRPSARAVSNQVVAQPGHLPNSAGASDFLWQWGQFLDHDITLAPLTSPGEAMPIAVPVGDPWFDPFFTGTQVIGLTRSAGDSTFGVREQINIITAYVDASNVYGSEHLLADELRANDGTGRLATSKGDLLPFNVNGFPNAPSPDPSFFLAGDERVNEQIGLTAMHTLFVREHNTWADAFRKADPSLTGDEVYELARAVVAAEMQAITYREFLPLLLGANALPAYAGYDPNVDPSISNVFATAAYRVGHTMLSPTLLRLKKNGQPIPQGNISLAASFFSPQTFVDSGIESLLRGLATQPAQEIDSYIVDDVRNFLFGPPGAGGFDLASLNIQRGRDHGLPSFNQVRADFGLTPYASFADVSSDPVVQANLAAAYASVDDIDIWVGGLSEDHVPGALVGETFHAILVDQFTRLRDGDRFWYEIYLPADYVELVEDSTLAEIIRRNTKIKHELQDDVFRVEN